MMLPSKKMAQTQMRGGRPLEGNLDGLIVTADHDDCFLHPEGFWCGLKPTVIHFSYRVRGSKVAVRTDLNSDYAIRKTFTNKNPEKAVARAQRELSRYGSSVSVATLIQNGWAVY
jgi:hypothetical protein